MKVIIFIAVVTCSSAAKLDRNYLPPPNAQTSGGSGSFLNTPYQSPVDYQRSNGNGFAPNNNGRNFDNYVDKSNDFIRPERPQASFERNAAVLRQDNQNDGETFSYAYETENGIYAEENGVATNGVEAQGGYSYTGDDGQVYSIRYTAGQNGFVPVGDHLPTAPPVPEEIQKALEQNSRDEAAGVYDDGSYNEAKYTGANEGYGYGTSSSGNGLNNGNLGDDTVVTNSADAGVFAGNRNAAFNRASNKAYLPPDASYRGGNGRNGFGRPRRPNYNARTGYQY